MIAIDTNILVYAHRRDSVWHDRARTVVAERAAAPGPWAIAWPCVHEFLAIVTHPKIFKTPTPVTAAIGQVRAWAESPTLRLLHETSDHLDVLADLLIVGKAIGPRVHDGRVASICLASGVEELWTVDRDFSIFPQLKTRNPLVS